MLCLFIASQIISRWLKLLKVHQPLAKSSHIHTEFRHSGSTGLVVKHDNRMPKGTSQVELNNQRGLRHSSIYLPECKFGKRPSGQAHQFLNCVLQPFMIRIASEAS